MTNVSIGIHNNVIKCNSIEKIIKGISGYLNNAQSCKAFCAMIYFVLEEDFLAQKTACEKGCIKTILKILRTHINNKDVCESCCMVLEAIFSTQELYCRFCVEEVLTAIQECFERHKDSEPISKFYLRIMKRRLNDKRSDYH